MTRGVVRLVLALIVAAVTVTDARAERIDDPWSSLRHRTGWLHLGDLNLRLGTWGTVPEHVIARRRRPGKGLIPSRGDLLKITDDAKVVIVGFQVTGERNRLVSPAGKIMRQEDLTGIVLLSGSIVEVVDVRRGPAVYGLQAIWVRVIPAKP